MAFAIQWGVFLDGSEEPVFMSTDPDAIQLYLECLEDDVLDTALVLHRVIDTDYDM